MIISMQGNWTVTVKSKSASFQQRFIIQGATTGNGTYTGTPGTTAYVTGEQWSIAIQNKPSTAWQLSDTQIKFPQQTGGNYEFDIWSNDAGADSDFNDLILTCSTPANVNDFIIYGNVTLYSGKCIFNPCRRFPFVIETYPGLLKALKNPLLRNWIEKYYPERIPPEIDGPEPPWPEPEPDPYFKPIVFDVSNVAMQQKTTIQYTRKAAEVAKRSAKSAKKTTSEFAASNFNLVRKSNIATETRAVALSPDRLRVVEDIEGLFSPCFTEAGSNLTLTFEEYDRTAVELAGGAYSGEGHRRLLGDTITDMNGNYIFRFSFDMTFPFLEDSSDIAPGEDVNTVMYPDVIVKIVDYSPFEVRYESVPYYNIPNIKRIDLCLPESQVRVTSACFNGNLIGSLGNVFIGGNQNTSASYSAINLQRYGNSNYLEETGVISVNSSLAGFNVECAAWRGTIDMKGCMYDTSKSAANNRIKWYTIRIRRSGVSPWTYVSQNYKHPKFSKRNDPGYIGDDVGPFYPNPGGALNGSVPAYINIQREIFADGIDWEFSNMDRYLRLNTRLYDIILGTRTPGKFYIRVDGYNSAGNLVTNATDLIALYIHNLNLKFELKDLILDDSAIVKDACGLHRLTDTQLKTPMKLKFQASDPYGFVDEYKLRMRRCPGTALDLVSNLDSSFTLNGTYWFTEGDSPTNEHNSCLGYKGSEDVHSNPGPIDVVIQPTVTGDGWIKSDEYFTEYNFYLKARQRKTNGYNTGVTIYDEAWLQILMERLST
ncbi:MAG: hypothetical protein ABFS16_00375 [Bacteroidota bacterium]